MRWFLVYSLLSCMNRKCTTVLPASTVGFLNFLRKDQGRSKPVVKTQTRTHNNEYGQVPMVTDLHMRPVMSFLCLGTKAGGVYMRTLGQRLGTPILQQGELPSCLGEGIYAAAQVYPL